MKIILILGSIIVPVVMLILQKRWASFRMIFHLLAIVSALVFGNIASTAIHTILHDDTVFMTKIHGIFLNPYFLLTGAYLGVYLIYILSLSFFKELGQRKS